MALNKITTPRGSIVQTGHGSARLEWDPSFATRQNEQFSRKQKFVDWESIMPRHMQPRNITIPLKAGVMTRTEAVSGSSE